MNDTSDSDAEIVTRSVAAPADAAKRQLAAALADLSPGDRDVVLLFAWASLSYNEIAQALDVPTGTVRSRLHRARRSPHRPRRRAPSPECLPEPCSHTPP